MDHSFGLVQAELQIRMFHPPMGSWEVLGRITNLIRTYLFNPISRQSGIVAFARFKAPGYRVHVTRTMGLFKVMGPFEYSFMYGF